MNCAIVFFEDRRAWGDDGEVADTLSRQVVQCTRHRIRLADAGRGVDHALEEAWLLLVIVCVQPPGERLDRVAVGGTELKRVRNRLQEGGIKRQDVDGCTCGHVAATAG